MHSILRNIFFIGVLSVLSLHALYAQPAADLEKSVKRHDFRDLWITHDVQPLGFIGAKFERLFIHIGSVTKSADDPLLYTVAGKSRVKNSVTSFKGSIHIYKILFDAESEFNSPDTLQGSVEGHYTFSEDCKEKHCGVFSGTVKTSIYYVKSKDSLYYDDLSAYADGYCNNLYEGTWESYDKKIKHSANWGDERIPGSGDLDMGAGEFYPDKKYYSQGWKNYSVAFFSSNTDSKEARAAREKEKEEWWK